MLNTKYGDSSYYNSYQNKTIHVLRDLPRRAGCINGHSAGNLLRV